MKRSIDRAARLRWALLACTTMSGCEDEPVTSSRGSTAPASDQGTPSRRSKKGSDTAADEGGAAAEAELPKRPPVALDSRSFARRRDPFQMFTTSTAITAAPVQANAERKVKMAQYAFEDLKLIAVVNSGRGIVPRALFLASDGKSSTIKQGEYFSSAEVLLAAVNRDYVEIEVVDDTLARSLNLERGERRALYLRTD